MSEHALLWGLGIVFSLVGYLLMQKDAAQQEEIKAINTSIQLLFEKHDADVIALTQLRLEIANGHYKKAELDQKFDRLEASFKEGFAQLSEKFDRFVELWQQRNPH